MDISKIKTSGFATIDITDGRHELADALDGGRAAIPVTITGFITSAWSGDDGVSIEFGIDVENIAVSAPAGRDAA